MKYQVTGTNKHGQKMSTVVEAKDQAWAKQSAKQLGIRVDQGSKGGKVTKLDKS